MIILFTNAIGAGFALLMAYSTFLNYKRKEFSKMQFLFWELVWLAVLAIVFFTNLATKIVESMGFTRVMDFLTVAGFIVLILLSFNNYSQLNKMKKSLEESVRKDALKNL